MNVTNISELVFEKNTRDSPITGCICLIGQHIHLISKYLTSDNHFDTLSRTKKQETKQIQFDSQF